MKLYSTKHRKVFTRKDNCSLTNKQSFVGWCISIIKAVLLDFDQGNFWESSEGVQGTTNFFGWYAIINKKNGKINFGSCTGDFAQRKGEYQRDFREFRENPQVRNPRLYASLRKEIEENNCTEDDFVFAPLVLLSKRDFNPLFNNRASGLDLQKTPWLQDIEKEVLDFFLESPIYKDRFYNTRSTSLFLPGNTSGGFRPGNVAPVAEVGGQNRAFESVSAAAAILQRDRGSICYYIERGTFKRLTLEEWNCWPEASKFTNPNRN